MSKAARRRRYRARLSAKNPMNGLNRYKQILLKTRGWTKVGSKQLDFGEPDKWVVAYL